jgi:hypothetical protein
VQFQNRIRHDRSSLRVIKYRDETSTFLTYSPAEAGLMRAGQFAVPEPRVRCPSSIKLPAPPQDRFKGDGEAVRTPSGARWWHAATAAMFGLTAKVAGEFHARNEIAFCGVLLAIMSWTIRQILTGCVAYAQAIYPHPVCVDLDQPVDRDDPESGSQPARSGKHQNRPLQASDISPGAGDESRSGGCLLQWRQARRVAHDGPRRDVPRHGARHGDLCG